MSEQERRILKVGGLKLGTYTGWDQALDHDLQFYDFQLSAEYFTQNEKEQFDGSCVSIIFWDDTAEHGVFSHDDDGEGTKICDISRLYLNTQ